MILIRILPISDCISVGVHLRPCVNMFPTFHTQRSWKLSRVVCDSVDLCVCVCEKEREPGIISDRNGLMGQHSMRSSWPRETHSKPVSEHMSYIFQCSDKFTPLPHCPLSYYNCLNGLTGHSGHTLVEQLPRIQQMERAVM